MTLGRRVDHAALRTNQAFTISLLALSFVFNAPALAAFTGAVMLISALVPPLGLFTRVYRHVLRPAGIVAPQVMVDNPEPHRFSQGFGGTVVTVAVLTLIAGVEFVGWALIALVIGLASLNLFARWCAGCMIYYWLNRLGVPGFNRSRIEATR